MRLRYLINFACLLAGALGIAVASDHVIAQVGQPSTNNSSLAAPPRPDEPRAAKAYGVFDTYCARCHQTGRLERPLASGGLANILAIDDQARDPVQVKPGIPDASRLYDVLETRHAPLDVFSGGN
ncbi:MAG TPA: hypothetical protein VIF39_04515, partial [Hyphomicrobium sp.]